MNKQLNRAIITSVVGKLSTYVVQFLLLMLYARLFAPNDFGVVASIAVFVVFFQLISDIGLGPALINEEKLSKPEWDGAFTFTCCVGIVIASLFALASTPIGNYYGSDLYSQVILVMSPAICFSCFCIVPNTAFVKELKFSALAILDSIAHLCSFIMVYLLTEYVNDAIALASKATFFSIIKFMLLMVFSNTTDMKMPTLGVEFSILKKAKRFAMYQFSFGMVNYFSRNSDNIIIAKFMGSHSLGIYDQAYQLMRYPLQLTAFALSSAIQPVMVSHKGNMKYIAEEHNKLSQKLLSLSLVIFLYINFNADLIVLIILGDKWEEVIIILKIFNYSLPIQMLIATSGAFFQSIGRPDLLFRAGLIGALIFLTCILSSLLFFTIEAVAWSISLSFLINSISIYYLLYKFGFKTSVVPFSKCLLFTVRKMIPYSLTAIVLYSTLNYLYFANIYINFLISIGAFFILLISHIKPLMSIMNERGLYKSGESS